MKKFTSIIIETATFEITKPPWRSHQISLIGNPSPSLPYISLIASLPYNPPISPASESLIASPPYNPLIRPLARA